LSTWGCVVGSELPDDERSGVASAAQGIQQGMLEPRYPAIGMIALPTGPCTGTLIAPSYVLTAKHCAGANMAFKTGTSAADFNSVPVDQQIMHPTLDMMIVHLAWPIESIPPIRLTTATSVTPVGSQCMAVGFGNFTQANGTDTNSVKRSATVRVTASDNAFVTVTNVTGIPDNGDSGGPLLCNGMIEGVAKAKTPNVHWPGYNTLIYTAMSDNAWIQRTIGPVYSELPLQNGWTNTQYGTRNAAVALVSKDIVQFKGAIANGTDKLAFTLPIGFRPTTDVYVSVDLCNATQGRLCIRPTGAVTIETPDGFSNAQCFTSLEGASFAKSAIGFTPLTLQSGWSNAPFGTSNAAVSNLDGIVRFKGAVATATASTTPFVLPAEYRPTTSVYLPTNVCGAKKGRILIQTSGLVSVLAEGATGADAQCFTSLDGLSFIKDTLGTTTQPLQGNWTGAPFSTAAPRLQIMSGVVHFMGAMKTTGTSGLAFTLPFAFRPTTTVYVPVDLCTATKGRLVIEPSGAVNVYAKGGTFANAACYTGLDGVAFTLSDFTPLTLETSWRTSYFSLVNKPGFTIRSGFVHFQGSISSGYDGVAFRLPLDARPTGKVYVPVTLCDSAKGSLVIQTNGEVTILAEGGNFALAQCATFLDGASFAVSTSGFTALTLQNSWTPSSIGTRNAAVTSSGGIVRLAGAIAQPSGPMNALAFTLPSAFWPSTDVYVSVDQCIGTKGRLRIATNGAVFVSSEGHNSNAQCFTSLEGVSFAQSAAGFWPMTLQNGWTNAPYSTRNAAAINEAGIIRLQGAIATTGTNTTAFTLPVGFRPLGETRVAVDLCGGGKGSLRILPSGEVNVQPSAGGWANAQCFTSLEGAFFGL